MERLGGKERAARKLSLYLRAPKFMTTRRGRAAACLGWCGPVAVPHLIRCLGDEHENVRWEAARALGDVGGAGAAAALEGASRNDPCRSVREAAKKALGKIKPAEAVKK